MKKRKNESGEVMIEGMIVMVITMLMLVWILGIGFIYYQKYVVRIATNDVAKKIAMTYENPASDIIMGYVSKDDILGRALYKTPELTHTNQLRSESYVKYIMDKANFNGTVKAVDVDVTQKHDAIGRSHITVTTECTFQTPFSEGLEIFGMSGKRTYRVTASADSTSISDYVSTFAIVDAFANGSIVSGGKLGKSFVKMINSLAGTYFTYTEDDDDDYDRYADNNENEHSGGGREHSDGDGSDGGGFRDDGSGGSSDGSDSDGGGFR